MSLSRGTPFERGDDRYTRSLDTRWSQYDVIGRGLECPLTQIRAHDLESSPAAGFHTFKGGSAMSKDGRFGSIALIGALALASALAAPMALAQQKVLKFIPQADLRILDPITTTAYITRNHGYMVYDTLFATDANFHVQPQMVDRYEVSPDKLTYTFTLRDGLKFHDGQPVRSADCIASIERWAKRDALGQKLAESTEAWTAVNDKTFTLKLKKPFP